LEKVGEYVECNVLFLFNFKLTLNSLSNAHFEVNLA